MKIWKDTLKGETNKSYKFSWVSLRKEQRFGSKVDNKREET